MLAKDVAVNLLVDFDLFDGFFFWNEREERVEGSSVCKLYSFAFGECANDSEEIGATSFLELECEGGVDV